MRKSKKAEVKVAVNPQILCVARKMSRILSKKGIKHALIGGLAVSAHGYDRATKDADFLVSEEAMEQIAGTSMGGEVVGKTIHVDGVDVDFLFPKPDQEFLENALSITKAGGRMPVVPLEVLVYMKLVSARLRDNGDIVELLKHGKVNEQKVVSYLRRHRPDLVEEFEALVVQAKYENK